MKLTPDGSWKCEKRPETDSLWKQGEGGSCEAISLLLHIEHLIPKYWLNIRDTEGGKDEKELEIERERERERERGKSVCEAFSEYADLCLGRYVNAFFSSVFFRQTGREGKNR